jgi:hypothetical protein
MARDDRKTHNQSAGVTQETQRHGKIDIKGTKILFSNEVVVELTQKKVILQLNSLHAFGNLYLILVVAQA